MGEIPKIFSKEYYQMEDKNKEELTVVYGEEVEMPEETDISVLDSIKRDDFISGVATGVIGGFGIGAGITYAATHWNDIKSFFRNLKTILKKENKDVPEETDTETSEETDEKEPEKNSEKNTNKNK